MTRAEQLSLFASVYEEEAAGQRGSIEDELLRFREFGKQTVAFCTRTMSDSGQHLDVPTFVNEFWTSRQRAASSLHEISYRACFKPQLPAFFIRRLTSPGDVVYDPFIGRGTTLIEAALLGRVPMGCDVNPLSVILTAPRLAPPPIEAVAARLREINFNTGDDVPQDLLVFYHPQTLRQICSLREYLLRREKSGELDQTDRWIRAVAVNRLTGHSPGFFSVYTLPPNQAVSVDAQRKINEKRKQVPPLRDVPELILKKSYQLLADCDSQTRRAVAQVSRKTILLTQPADHTPEIASCSVDLVVTSPPFLDVVDYAQDNWLRWWFCGIDPHRVGVTVARQLGVWQEEMERVFAELARVLRRGGHVAFEVGEVRGGTLKLEEIVLPVGLRAGLSPVLVLINDQRFTKTAHCWGVSNNRKGTNTNRVVLFRKE